MRHICFNKLLSSYPVEKKPTVCIPSKIGWISWWKSTTHRVTYAQVRSRLDFFGVMMLLFVTLPSKYGIFTETILEDIFNDPSLVYQPLRTTLLALAVCHYDVTCCWLETFASEKKIHLKKLPFHQRYWEKKYISKMVWMVFSFPFFPLKHEYIYRYCYTATPFPTSRPPKSSGSNGKDHTKKHPTNSLKETHIARIP